MCFASIEDTQEKWKDQGSWKGLAWLKLRGSKHDIRFPLERTADN
jgi:hypothetical protein